MIFPNMQQYWISKSLIRQPFQSFCVIPNVFFCPVSERQAEPGGAEHPAPPAGHDGEFIHHRLAVFPVNGANGKQKVPPPPHPFCPFSSRWFGCNIFSVTGALTLSVLIVLPRISGLYSQIIADYQAECEINPLTASHWCSAACWAHYRAPGSNCSAPRSQQRVQWKPVGVILLCAAQDLSLARIRLCACTGEICETEAHGSFKAWTLC